jgi:excisionase family DNA binding protein
VDFTDRLTVPQAAKRLGVYDSTVYVAIRRGRIEIIETPLGLLCNLASVEAYAVSRRRRRHRGERLAAVVWERWHVNTTNSHAIQGRRVRANGPRKRGQRRKRLLERDLPPGVQLPRGKWYLLPATGEWISDRQLVLRAYQYAELGLIERELLPEAVEPVYL